MSVDPAAGSLLCNPRCLTFHLSAVWKTFRSLEVARGIISESTAISLNRIMLDPRREGRIISMLLFYIWRTAEGLIKSPSNQCCGSNGHFPLPLEPKEYSETTPTAKRVASDTSSQRMRLTSHPPPTGISNVTELIF